VHAQYEEAVRELQHCADKHQEQMLHLDHSNKSLAFYKKQANVFHAELNQQTQDITVQEQRVCDFGRTELTEMTAQCEARMQNHIDAKTEQTIADAVKAVRDECREELADVQSCHEAAVAAVIGECSEQIENMRNTELASRDELQTSRLCCEAAEAAGEETLDIEAAKATALRVHGEALHMELRKELWTESCNKARQEVLDEVRGNPCSNLRRELCRDLRHELTDQLRAEIQHEMRSEHLSRDNSLSLVHGSPPRASVNGAGPIGSPSPTSPSTRRRLAEQGSSAKFGGRCGTSFGIGASPSSIGACSTVVSSPACAASALLMPPDQSSSSSCTYWADEQPFGDVSIVDTVCMPGSTSVTSADADPSWKEPAPASWKEPAPAPASPFARRPQRVSASAPASRQSSQPQFQEQTARQTGVFRQQTDPVHGPPPSWLANRLEGMLPPPPQPPATHGSGLDSILSALPPPPGSLQEVAKGAELGSIDFKPHAPPSTSFQDQASAVLEMVSRSRAPFRSSGFPRKDLDRSFGRLPAWPGPSSS